MGSGFISGCLNTPWKPWEVLIGTQGSEGYCRAKIHKEFESVAKVDVGLESLVKHEQFCCSEMVGLLRETSALLQLLCKEPKILL